MRLTPRDWVGTVTPSQLAFPYLVNWGYPERFHQEQSADERLITGIGGLARASSRASPASSARSTSSTRSATATSSSAR